MERCTAITAITLRNILPMYPLNEFFHLGIELAISHHERWIILSFCSFKPSSDSLIEPELKCRSGKKLKENNKPCRIEDTACSESGCRRDTSMEIDICRHCHNQGCARKVPIFSSLTNEEIADIIRITGHFDYSKGEFLCHEGEKASELFIVNEGKVKLSKFNRDGKEQILRILSNGSFFGEYYLLSESVPCNFSAIAVTDLKICTLGKAQMDKLLKVHPEIGLKLLKEVSTRLIQTENLAGTLSSQDTDSKVAYILLEMAEKYGVPSTEGIRIETPLNREEMANYAGVTRETMSRKLSSFEKTGMIKVTGHRIIIITDKAGLEEFL